MLHQPTVRLTGWYLLIIMSISLSFSYALYRVTTAQVEAGLRQQAMIFRERRFIPPFSPEPIEEELLQAQLAEVQRRIGLTLILLNGGILLVAGTSSYLLARRTLQPIEEALEIQRRFTADASHELRTPLTAMRTEIEVVLRDKTASQDGYRHILQSNLEEVQRLERLSQGLLHLAQYEEQGQPMAATMIDIGMITSEACQQISKSANENQITIKREGDAGTVAGDHHQLVELLVILLDNAIKYSPKKTTVNVAITASRDHVSVRIKDQGIGIKASEIPHLFDRFYRADLSRSKEKVEGYGLGLPIAKQIVERHHGNIDIQSTPNKGTTVTVTLPREKS